MKIGTSPEVAKTDALLPKDGRAGTSSSAPVSPVEAVDKIELSAAARAAESISNAPEVRADKVIEIRQAIEAGEFRVNPSDIADRMISEAASLLETIARQDNAIDKAENRDEPTSPPKADKRS